jgi:hypothetical protein
MTSGAEETGQCGRWREGLLRAGGEARPGVGRP